MLSAGPPIPAVEITIQHHISALQMALPAKIQASILSWVGESSAAAPSEPAATEDSAAASAAAPERYRYPHPLLTPADLFSLSSEALAAGSPGVVVKDGFLGREHALRAYDGESFLFLGLDGSPIVIVLLVSWAQWWAQPARTCGTHWLSGVVFTI